VRDRNTFASPGAPWLTRLLLLVALTVVAPGSWAAQYTYDALGRVIQVVESDGSSIHYTYDASGNITSINRTGGSSPVVINAFAPASGAIGAQVSIYGAGFSLVASQNTVQFNGVSAVVSSSTGSMLVVTVPAGASTGAISVTTSAGSASSATPFIVTAVAITGFTPAVGVAGTLVTVDGTGFDPTPANNAITFNTTAGTVTSASTTQLQATVPASATSGFITVAAPAGTAVSAENFVVPPPGYVASDVVMVGHLVAGGIGRVFTINSANRLGGAFFHGTAGQAVTLVLTNITMGGIFKIFAPDGSQFYLKSINTPEAIDLPLLPATGTYSLFLMPGSETGSITVRFATDANGTIATNGTPLSIASQVGQNFNLSFSGTAGQTLNLDLEPIATNPSGGTVSAQVLNPNGTLLKDCGTFHATSQGCRFTLGTTGVFTLRLDPYQMYAATFTARLAVDFVQTMTPGSAPLNLSLVAAQNASLPFTVTAGQIVALNIDSIATTPASTYVHVYLYASSGSLVTSILTTTRHTFNLENLAADTYTILIVPRDAAAATMTVTLAAMMGGPLTASGVGTTYSATVQEQNAYFTFAGTAGETLGIGMTELSATPSGASAVMVHIYKPDGSVLDSSYCYFSDVPGCAWTMRNLPATGTYRVRVVSPDGATMSFKLTLSPPVTDTLTVGGSAYNLSLDSPGETALLGFTLGSAQTIAFYVGSYASVPASKSTNVTLYDSGGTQVATTSVSAPNSSKTLNLTNLAAGSYSVLFESLNAAPVTMAVQLAAMTGGASPVDGTSATYATGVPGQNAYFTFSGTAGQTLGLGITELSLTPSSGSVPILIKKPDGTNLMSSFTCSTFDSPGCQKNLRNLPATGTYRIEVDNADTSNMSVKMTLSAAVTDTLTLGGSAVNLNLAAPGQNAMLTFTLPTTQTVALNFGSIATTPAGKQTEVALYNSSNTLVQSWSASTPTVKTMNIVNLAAGTYTVLFSSPYAAPVTLTSRLATMLGGALLADGTGTTYATVVDGQNAYFTFSGTAGQTLGLGVTEISMPANASATLSVFKPDGSALGSSVTCSLNGSVPGCQIAMRNLPATGTYRAQLVLNSVVAMSVKVTLSPAVTGTLTVGGTALSVNLASSGQPALLTFTTTSTQTLALVRSSLVTVPSGKTIDIKVFNASGTQVASGASSAASATLNLNNLPAGTYSVFIVSTNAATATMNVGL